MKETGRESHVEQREGERERIKALNREIKRLFSGDGLGKVVLSYDQREGSVHVSSVC